MTTRATRFFLPCAIGLVLASALAVSAGPQDKFPLAAAVPDDVFLCDLGRHNPEGDFIGEYWGTVFAALEQSGVLADLWSLIGTAAGPEGTAQVEHYKEMATKLCQGVDWDALCGSDRACAMRMPKINRAGGGMNVGGADMIALLRGTNESAAKNFEGLCAILDALVAEVNKAAEGEVIKVNREEKLGAKVASLYPPEGSGAHYGLSLAYRGDLIIIALGDMILDDSLALLAGQSQGKPLSASARFQAAFQGMPEAEDGVTYFDMKVLLAGLKEIADTLFPMLEMMDSGPGEHIVNSGKNEEAGVFHGQAMEAYNAGDTAKALAAETQAHEKDPTDPLFMYNLACFEALAGNKDKALNWLEKSVEAGFYSPGKIASDSDLISLREDPRYAAAVAKASAKAAELGGGEGGGSEVQIAKSLVDRGLGLLGMIDYSIDVRYTDGHATFAESRTFLSPDADKNPFYNVFAKRPPQTDFDRYLPAEATSFAVTSGIDLTALYDYAEETARSVGPEGAGLLAEWEQMQQTMGFNLRKDLLSWIHGDSVSVTLDLPSGEQWVWMLKVTDEAAAREKLTAGLDFVAKKLPELTAGNPMMAMLALRTSPCANEALPGFSNVFFGMSPIPMVCGVKDGYLILAGSDAAVVTCFDTAAGKHPNIRKNERVMAEALIPNGPFDSISLTDMRKLGEQIAGVLGVVSMVGGMATMAMPPEVQPIVAKIMGMVAKLGPVATKLNFYKSTATSSTFDGKVWHVKTVTNYVAPSERTAAAAR